jgi:large subunit ribosomal protein L16
MKQNPKKLKFRRYHLPPSSFFLLLTKRQFMPQKGFFGLKALESGKLKFIHIEAARRTIRRVTKKNGELFINLFPFFSITRKSSGSRMGRGKGKQAF